MILERLKRLLAAPNRVGDDWFANLPGEKSDIYRAVVSAWELAYGMLSITLDEALAMRRQGNLVYARQQAAVSSELFERLALPLVAALDALADQGRHFGALPAVEPLKESFFRGETARRTASRNSLLHYVLLSHRSRFFYKLRALSSIVESLAQGFYDAADEIAEGSSVRPERSWETLECLHFDLNTCLRETEVLLKSFLRHLPAGQLSSLQERLLAPATQQVRHAHPRLCRASA